MHNKTRTRLWWAAIATALAMLVCGIASAQGDASALLAIVTEKPTWEDVTGLIARYDPSVLTTIAYAGPQKVINTIDDLSGNTNTLFQLDAFKRMKVLLAEINGLNAIGRTSVGEGSWMEFTTPLSAYPYTAVWVTKAATTTSFGIIFGTVGTESISYPYWYYSDGTSYTYGDAYWGSSGRSAGVHIESLWTDGSTAYLARDGLSFGGVAVTVDAWVTSHGYDRFSQLFYNSSAIVDYGCTGEFLFYNRVLSTTDRQLVENYLIAKWGTP